MSGTLRRRAKPHGPAQRPVVQVQSLVERYDPDLWTDEFYFLNQPGQAEIQSDLFYGYRTNVDAYPKWQAWMYMISVPGEILDTTDLGPSRKGFVFDRFHPNHVYLRAGFRQPSRKPYSPERVSLCSAK